MPQDHTAAPDAPRPWQEGWWTLARHCPSPNFGPRLAGRPITLAVVHSISLPPGQYGGPEIEQLFTNQLDWEAHPYFQQIRGMEVSSHFVIRRDGEVIQQGPFAGAEIAVLNPALADRLGGDPFASGTIVTSVGGRTAARANGFQAGDIVTQIDGRPVRDLSAIRRVVRGSEVTIQRQGRVMTGRVGYTG